MRNSGLRVFVGALVVQVARTAAAAGGFTVDQVMADLNLSADAAARLRHEPSGAAEANRYLAVNPGDTLNLSADEIQTFNALAMA